MADATRLEQSLVLLFQLIELGFRVVMAFNFMDVDREVPHRCSASSGGSPSERGPHGGGHREGVDDLCRCAFSESPVLTSP
ncbi:MAG: hypothetical protein ACLFUV_07300 [Methanomassiliicoccales archaeon]